jgi:hypothetical protein
MELSRFLEFFGYVLIQITKRMDEHILIYFEHLLHISENAAHYVTTI